MKIEFEPEIELPAHPYEAAIIFFAAMAYPERGAGQIGAPGQRFATSLLNYMRWQARHHKGLAQFRKEMNDPDFVPPQWAEFQGAMNRGLRRLRRRAASYSLHGTRMIQGFFALRSVCAEAEAEGRLNDVYDMAPNGKFGVAKPEIWARSIRSAQRTVASDIGRWAPAFELNVTGKPADEKQKTKDLVRRAFSQSLPVMHMAHAINEACIVAGPAIGDFEQRDPVLALLMNADSWIDEAVITAERWRLSSGHPMSPDVNPESLYGSLAQILRQSRPRQQCQSASSRLSMEHDMTHFIDQLPTLLTAAATFLSGAAALVRACRRLKTGQSVGDER